VWRRFPGPLPQPGLEEVLHGAIEEAGWETAAITKALAVRGVRAGEGVPGKSGKDGASCEPGESGEPAEPGEPADPAENDPAVDPILMRRLEVLLELLVLARGDDPDRDGVQTLAPGEGRTAISFWLPNSLREEWNRALDGIRARWGPLPTWAAAILLLEAAVREWERVDPDRVPTEARILERDEYRCQVPGCSARRNLEVHHILFRSQGGTDDPANLLTLCHTHHQHLLHGDRTVRLTGRAPHGLRWELGRPIRARFRGERKLAPAGPLPVPAAVASATARPRIRSTTRRSRSPDGTESGSTVD
jgi:hypothetical protein